MPGKFIIHDDVLETCVKIDIREDTGKEPGIRDNTAIVPEGIKVIGQNAFKGLTFLEEVVLPESVTTIQSNAFKGCKNLKKINFPNKLTHIGSYAFHRCRSLTHIRLPVSVKELPVCAFLLCNHLENVEIPGVTKLGNCAFVNNDHLKTLTVSQDLDITCLKEVFAGCIDLSVISVTGTDSSTEYFIDNSVEALFGHVHYPPLVNAIIKDIFMIMQINDKGGLEKFFADLREVCIPRGITSIETNCFYNKKGIISVSIPSTVQTIDAHAFGNCINLEKVRFLNDQVKICDGAFLNCTTLKTIELSDGSEYQLHGLSDPHHKNPVPDLVRTIRSQTIYGNFFISGTTLIRYRGAEERVVVPDGITTIGEKAFAANEVIGKVILPDTINEIHEEAFADCLMLQTINFPKGLSHLGKSAFENCVKLLRAELPDSLKIIEKSAFNRCKQLNKVKLGSGVHTLGDLAFYACVSLPEIQFPPSLNHIGAMAFYQCRALREVTLPPSLTSIGSNAFTLSGILSATFACDLDIWGSDILSQCETLEKITFCDGVKKVGDKFAFHCPSLKTVDLPLSLESIGRNAFEGSLFLQNLPYIPAPHETQGSMRNLGTIILDGRLLSGDIIIPEGVSAIAGGAFYGNTLITSVVVPDSLKIIGSRAFCGCTSLKNIHLSDRIQKLDEGTFAYCTDLESVSGGKVVEIADNAFYKCTHLKAVPSTLTEKLGKNAFAGCLNLSVLDLSQVSDFGEDAFRETSFLRHLINSASFSEPQTAVILNNIVVDGTFCTGSLILPDGVLAISPYAFSGNDNITSIIFPSSLQTIENGAFWGCKNLKEVTFRSRMRSIGEKAFEKCLSLVELFVDVVEINAQAFSHCVSLKQVHMIGTHIVGQEAFYGCVSLERVYNNELGYSTLSMAIGDSSFSGCEALRGFDFRNVRSIGDFAFASCNSLRSISLTGDTIVGAHSFEDCGTLQQMALSHPDLTYGSYAFSGCTALDRITIGTMSYKIDAYSFIQDTSIPNTPREIYANAVSCFDIDETLTLHSYQNNGRYIHIPKGVKKISAEVFKNCLNLEEIMIPSSVQDIGDRAFLSTPWLEKQKEKSQVDFGFVIINGILIDGTKCQGDIIIPGTVKSIAGWAFANCFELTGITFSSEDTFFYRLAFRNCINVKRVTMDGETYILSGIDVRQKNLPPRVKDVFLECLNCFKTNEDNMLIECSRNIRELPMPRGITGFGNSVFKESRLLTRLVLTPDITYIGDSAFESCKWLVSVENCDCVSHIGKKAFSGCYSLESFDFSDSLEHIGAKAFENCISLKNIIIPEGITEVPERAFFRCKSLQSVTLPSSVQRIAQEAFAYCSQLTNIHMPPGVVLENHAFAWCPIGL